MKKEKVQNDLRITWFARQLIPLASALNSFLP